MTTLLLTSAGCWDDIDFSDVETAEDCEAPWLYPEDVELAVRGERNASVLAGVCDGTVCSAEAPLVAGTTHGFELYVDPATAGQVGLPGDYALVSAAPEVVHVEEGIRKSYLVNGEYFDEDLCVSALGIELRGDLEALAPGSARIDVTHKGETIDSYTIVVGGPEVPDAGM